MGEVNVVFRTVMSTRLTIVDRSVEAGSARERLIEVLFVVFGSVFIPETHLASVEDSRVLERGAKRDLREVRAMVEIGFGCVEANAGLVTVEVRVRHERDLVVVRSVKITIGRFKDLVIGSAPSVTDFKHEVTEHDVVGGFVGEVSDGY